MRQHLGILLAACLVSACSSTITTPTPPATSTGPQVSCGPAHSDVLYLLPSDLVAGSAKLRMADAALAAHGFVVLCGGDALRLAGDLGLHDTGSVAVGTADQQTVGFYLSRANVVNEYDGFIRDATDASDALNGWIQLELGASLKAEPTIGSGWQSAFTRTTTHETGPFGRNCPSSRVTHPEHKPKHFTPCKNFSQATFGYYRLSDINPHYDWYMTTIRISGRPDWRADDCRDWFSTHPAGGYNWWSNSERQVTIEPSNSPAGVTLYANGPPTTESTGNVSYTLGVALGADLTPGVTGAFSATWTQPHVAIANKTLGTIAQQHVVFEPPGILCEPVPTTIETMSSDHAAMYQVPEGSSLAIKGGPVIHYTAWDSAQRTDLTATFAADFTFMPSVLAAAPQEITIPRGAKKTLHITARIGPSNLAWTMTNIPNWLVVSRTSGVGDTDVSLEAQGGERGTIAYLNIDTRPVASASSVERGPLVVRVRKP